MSSSADPIDADPPQAGTAYVWFVVLALSLLQIGSYIDRQVINLLVEPMRRDFAVNDTQVSLLLGFAFSLFYALMAVPIGRLADSYSRVVILVISVLFWSVATLGCMIASGYWGLFLARTMVGLGEAAVVPAAFSMLSDYFRPGKLAIATGTVTGASFLGSGIALALGGTVIASLPTTPLVSVPLFGEIRSWQLAFGFASVPSLVFLTLFFFVQEPVRRGQAAAAPAATLRESLAYLANDKSLWLSVFLGMALVNCYQYGLTAWVPTFFMRTYGWTPAEIGNVFGIIFVVFGMLGTVSGGWLCDFFFNRIGRRAFMVMPLISATFAIPLVIAFALAGDADVSALLLAPLTYFGTLSFGAVIASIPSLVPNRMRAQLVAAYMLLGTIFGQGGGPWFIALFTAYVFKDPQMIRGSIAIVCPAILALGAFILWIGLRAITRREKGT